jgi:hypothetical protein
MKMKTIRNVATVDVVDQPGRMPFGVSRSGHLVRDVLLTPPTPREFATWAASMARSADLGKVWTGAFEPILDALNPRDREVVFSRLDAYREMKGGDAVDVSSLFSDQFKGKPGATDTNPDEKRFMGRTSEDTTNMAADMNARNKALWDERLRR